MKTICRLLFSTRSLIWDPVIWNNKMAWLFLLQKLSDGDLFLASPAWQNLVHLQLFDTILNLFLAPRLYLGPNQHSWKDLSHLLDELETWSKQPENMGFQSFISYCSWWLYWSKGVFFLFSSIFSFWLRIMGAGWILEQGIVIFLPPLDFEETYSLLSSFISELLCFFNYSPYSNGSVMFHVL